MTELHVGDNVAFTRDYLDSLTGNDKADRAQWRGVIRHREPQSELASVEWRLKGDHEDTPGFHTIVNVGNLCRPRSVAFTESTGGVRDGRIL